jgi:hypothetical protein
MRKAMEKVEPLDAATLDLLALAPPSEIVNRVRADYLVLKLNPAGNNIIVGGGSNARREKWIPILKQRKPDILAHLRGERSSGMLALVSTAATYWFLRPTIKSKTSALNSFGSHHTGNGL